MYTTTQGNEIIVFNIIMLIYVLVADWLTLCHMFSLINEACNKALHGYDARQ